MQKLEITEHGGIERENHVWHLSIMSATNSHDHEIFYFFEYKQPLYAFRYWLEIIHSIIHHNSWWLMFRIVYILVITCKYTRCLTWKFQNPRDVEHCYLSIAYDFLNLQQEQTIIGRSKKTKCNFIHSVQSYAPRKFLYPYFNDINFATFLSKLRCFCTRAFFMNYSNTLRNVTCMAVLRRCYFFSHSVLLHHVHMNTSFFDFHFNQENTGRKAVFFLRA